MHLTWRKLNGSPSIMHSINQKERSLTICLIFQDSISQLALFCSVGATSSYHNLNSVSPLQRTNPIILRTGTDGGGRIQQQEKIRDKGRKTRRNHQQVRRKNLAK